MLRKLTEDIAEVIASNTSLTSYLNSLHSTIPTTKRTWLWDGEHGRSKFREPDDLLAEWYSYLQENLSDENIYFARVMELEKSQLEKYGPQGGHPPIDEVLEEKILPSWQHDYGELSVSDPAALNLAKERVKKTLHAAGVVNLRPALHESVARELQREHKLVTNSGWPDFKTRNHPDVLSRAIEDAKSGAWETYPAIPLFRFYHGKLRVVWMYALASNLEEATYVRTLTKRIISSPLVKGFFAPWAGFDAVKSLVTDTYRKYPDSYIVASDYSSTDQHFVAALSSEAGDILESCFQASYRDAMRRSLMAMHSVPMIVSTDEMITGFHGVASGSEWTNFIETVSQNMVGEYAAITTDDALRPLYGLGDDMAWLVSKKIAPDEAKKMIADIGAQFGQDIQPSKTVADPDYVKSLQRLMQKGYFVEGSSILRGVYPTVRAFNSLIYPEKWHTDDEDPFDKYDFAVRVFQILENTCDHPLFTQFCQFVLGGNKFLVDFAMAPDSVIDNAYARSKRFNDLVSTYNVEYAKRKLSKFRAIQAARNVLRDKL